MTGGRDLELDRLRWRCRRGVRELDVLLERYLSRRWPTASPERRAAFAALLELPDAELADLCLGRSVTPVTELAGLIVEMTEAPDGELSGPDPVYNACSGHADRPERKP